METSFTVVTPQTLDCGRHAIDHGALLLCHGGSAVVHINFDRWSLSADGFIVFYPGDIVGWEDVSADFEADMLCYSRDVLRAASMNIEHEVYRDLRDDRICDNRRLIDEVVKGLFGILRFYFKDDFTPNVDRIVSLQIQAFFMGFADYMRFHPDSPRLSAPVSGETPRMQQLFSLFMQLVEELFQQGHEVTFYARRMNISAKYLGRITRAHTGLSPKRIIDDYVVEQLKLSFRSSSRSLKELAAAFGFSDQSALTRYFKAHCGCTPKQYKESLAKGMGRL